MSVKASVAIALAMLCCASEARAVQGGTEDHTTSHAVAIGRGPAGSPSVVCSGTLVSANVVLTARHCLASVDRRPRACDGVLGALPDPFPSDVWVNVSPWTNDGAKWRKAANARVPVRTSICGDDIALLTLAERVPESDAVPARPVLDEASFLAYAEDRALGLAAFGVTDPRVSDLGIRRSRFDIPLRCLPGRPGFACGIELDFMSASELTSGAGPCRGDSGGGAMPARDRGVVMGVLSRGDVSRTEDTCTLGVFERTDVWAWLIARAVIDAAGDRTQAPEWATRLFPLQPRVGDFCSGTGSCGSDAECVSLDDERSFMCAARCASDETCGAARRCESGVCVPRPPATPPAPDGGCASAPGGASGEAFAAAAIALAVVSARRGRRDRSAASCGLGRSAARPSVAPSSSSERAR